MPAASAVPRAGHGMSTREILALSTSTVITSSGPSIPAHRQWVCRVLQHRDVPPASAHPAPGAEIRTHAAISSGTHESFHVQFPHQVHRHVSKAIIPLPNGLCSGIVSRTFLYTLGIPDSLKLPFLVTTAHRAISKTLAAPSPGLPLFHNGREQQGLVSLGNNGRFPGFLWRSTLVAESRVGCRCRANVKEQMDLHSTHWPWDPGKVTSPLGSSAALPCKVSVTVPTTQGRRIRRVGHRLCL